VFNIFLAFNFQFYHFTKSHFNNGMTTLIHFTFILESKEGGFASMKNQIFIVHEDGAFTNPNAFREFIFKPTSIYKEITFMVTLLKINKRSFSVTWGLLALVGTVFAFGPDNGDCHHSHNDNRQIKNVIVIVPDGCNQVLQTVCRWYKGSDLTVDRMASAMARTWSANSVITASAAASSAFSTGFKTEEPFISVGPSGDPKIMLSTYNPPFPYDYLAYRPLATVLEGAKSVGKATGLIATFSVTNATPAGQSSHVHSRSNELDIAEQQVYQNIDVVFGGGKNKLSALRATSKGGDGENLIDTLTSRGYQWVETRDQMLTLTKGKVWGLFANEAMQPDIDRSEFAPTEPTLAEMTKKAIEILSQNRKGFYLFVEASQTDYGDHFNDAIYSISDFLAFDEAVKVAIDFAKADGHTAVLAFPDHNCGGMSIGSYASDTRVSFEKMPVEYFLDPLKKMRLTSAGVANKIGSANLKDTAKIKAGVLEWWGIDLTNADVGDILSWSAIPVFAYQLGPVIAKKFLGIGWTTHTHEGGDVPIWTYNCDISGSIENTQLADIVFDMLDVDSKKLNDFLFVDVNGAFPSAWSLDVTTDAKNPVLVVTAKGATFKLPVWKNELFYSKTGSTVKKLLSGVVVYALKTNRVYIPGDAVMAINRIAGE
jgi:alkaline phosphatase